MTTTRSVVETAEAVRRGETTALQTVREAFERIAALNPALNAFIQIDRESAEQAAAEIDARVARGEPVGPLAGVPIGVKDLEACRGFRVTQGSWFLRDSPVCTHVFQPTTCRGCLSPSSPPSRWARGRAWGFGSATTSSPPRAVVSRSTARLGWAARLR